MFGDQTDQRTLQTLAREALRVQDACNLSGVVHSFARAISRLRALEPTLGTDQINRHPIVVAWCSKVADLSGAYSSKRADEAFTACRALAGAEHA